MVKTHLVGEKKARERLNKIAYLRATVNYISKKRIKWTKLKRKCKVFRFRNVIPY